MAADDFKTFAARERYQQLEAERARAVAELMQAEAAGDRDAAGDAEEAIATIEVRQANLANLHDRYVRSQQPPAPPELTQEEKHAKSLEKMDFGDVWELSQNSKYGVDENAFRRGMAEVARRRARGE